MKRSAPLSRKTPLRRKTKLTYKRTPNPSGSDSAYLAWIRKQPCALHTVRHEVVCGPSHAHHITVGRGLSRKAPDRDTIPLCQRHHRAFHDAAGWFNGWTREERRVWQLASVAYYQRIHAEEQERRSA